MISCIIQFWLIYLYMCLTLFTENFELDTEPCQGFSGAIPKCYLWET